MSGNACILMHDLPDDLRVKRVAQVDERQAVWDNAPTDILLVDAESACIEANPARLSAVIAKATQTGRTFSLYDPTAHKFDTAPGYGLIPGQSGDLHRSRLKTLAVDREKVIGLCRSVPRVCVAAFGFKMGGDNLGWWSAVLAARIYAVRSILPNVAIDVQIGLVVHESETPGAAVLMPGWWLKEAASIARGMGGEPLWWMHHLPGADGQPTTQWKQVAPATRRFVREVCEEN